MQFDDVWEKTCHRTDSIPCALYCLFAMPAKLHCACDFFNRHHDSLCLEDMLLCNPDDHELRLPCAPYTSDTSTYVAMGTLWRLHLLPAPWRVCLVRLQALPDCSHRLASSARLFAATLPERHSAYGRPFRCSSPASCWPCFPTLLACCLRVGPGSTCPFLPASSLIG